MTVCNEVGSAADITYFFLQTTSNYEMIFFFSTAFESSIFLKCVVIEFQVKLVWRIDSITFDPNWYDKIFLCCFRINYSHIIKILWIFIVFRLHQWLQHLVQVLRPTTYFFPFHHAPCILLKKYMKLSERLTVLCSCQCPNVTNIIFCLQVQ